VAPFCLVNASPNPANSTPQPLLFSFTPQAPHSPSPSHSVISTCSFIFLTTRKMK
jgi:hypothetical protein